MSCRRNWDAVRMVAEDIAIGDRSYCNLTKNPNLPTPGCAAIDELDRRGLVKASFREDRVDPTEAFWPWLEEVRQAEQEAAAEQTNAALPGRQAVANSNPGKTPMVGFASAEGNGWSAPCTGTSRTQTPSTAS
jgi:hypothetical protein